MLKQILIPFILLLSFSLFAQKKELKSVDKLIQNEDYASALEHLLAAQSLFKGSELKYQVQYHFLAGKIYSEQKQLGAAFEPLSSQFTIKISIPHICALAGLVPWALLGIIQIFLLVSEFFS